MESTLDANAVDHFSGLLIIYLLDLLMPVFYEKINIPRVGTLERSQNKLWERIRLFYTQKYALNSKSTQSK